MPADSTANSNWFLTPPTAATARLRLYSFPYAGGGTWVFRSWPRLLGGEVVPCPAKLPGRADRFREQPYTDLHALADAITHGATGQFQAPYALFGYSMGALLAYECALRLSASGAPAPVGLVVAAAPAPQLLQVSEPLHALPDADLVRAVQERYRNPFMEDLSVEMLPLVLPALRGDMTMYETYSARSGSPPLPCPIVALSGHDDKIPPAHITAWQGHTAGGFTARTFPGGHFFIHEHEQDVVDYTRNQLGLWPCSRHASPHT